MTQSEDIQRHSFVRKVTCQLIREDYRQWRDETRCCRDIACKDEDSHKDSHIFTQLDEDSYKTPPEHKSKEELNLETVHCNIINVQINKTGRFTYKGKS